MLINVEDTGIFHSKIILHRRQLNWSAKKTYAKCWIQGQIWKILGGYTENEWNMIDRLDYRLDR